MRRISPVKTEVVDSYYSQEDLILQMVFYGDITPWRTGRLMRVAEECKDLDRAVLVLTENDMVDHLASHGFLSYRSGTIGINPVADASVIVTRLAAGESVVVNTNVTNQLQKNLLIRALVDGLSEMPLGNFAMVVESTESFFPRRRSRGDTAGMDTMNNLLKRAKSSRAFMAFGAESPQEMAQEIANSAGTPIVGLISNSSRLRAVGEAIGEPRLYRYGNEIYGAKLLDQRDFYQYNHYTSARQNPNDPNDQTIEVGIAVNGDTLANSQLLPTRLKDQKIACGFQPMNPTPGPEAEGDEQTKFEDDLATARAEEESKGSGTPQETTQSVVPGNVVKMRHKARPAPRSRIEGRSAGFEMLTAEGLSNGLRLMTIGRTVVNARGGKLYAPLDQRITARSLAQRIIDDKSLQEAIRAGFNVSHRAGCSGTTGVSAGAYGAAFYQALKEDAELARAFHAEMWTTGRRTGQRSSRALDVEATLFALASMTDVTERGEAQYQMIRNAWNSYRLIARKAA